MSEHKEIAEYIFDKRNELATYFTRQESYEKAGFVSLCDLYAASEKENPEIKEIHSALNDTTLKSVAIDIILLKELIGIDDVPRELVQEIIQYFSYRTINRALGRQNRPIEEVARQVQKLREGCECSEIQS